MPPDQGATLTPQPTPLTDDELRRRAGELVVALEEFSHASLIAGLRTPVGSMEHPSLDELEAAGKQLRDRIFEILRDVRDHHRWS